MRRLIDADEAVKAVHDEFDECLVWDESGATTANEFENIILQVPTVDIDAITESHERIGYDRGFRDGYAEAMEKTDNVPEKNVGKWTDVNGDGSLWRCSVCGETQCCYDNYRGNCGAKMGKDEWEEPEINPCRGCNDYDGRGGCKSNGGCGAKMDEVGE